MTRKTVVVFKNHDPDFGPFNDVACPVDSSHQLNNEPGGYYCFGCHLFYDDAEKPEGGRKSIIAAR